MGESGQNSPAYGAGVAAGLYLQIDDLNKEIQRLTLRNNKHMAEMDRYRAALEGIKMVTHQAGVHKMCEQALNAESKE